MNILLLFPVFIVAFDIVLCYEFKIRRTEQRNKVHFYVARDKDKTLWLYLEKPIKDEDCDRYIPYRGGNAIIGRDKFKDFNLNPNDFKNLSFDDNPVEVFLNLED